MAARRDSGKEAREVYIREIFTKKKLVPRDSKMPTLMRFLTCFIHHSTKRVLCLQ